MQSVSLFNVWRASPGFPDFPIIGNVFPRFSNHWKIGWATLALFSALSARADITMRFEFSSQEVNLMEVDGFVLPSLQNGLTPDTTPGWPAVPSRFVNILLPEGEAFVSLDVQAESRILAEDVTLYPAQPPRQPGLPPPAFVGPDRTAYSSVGPMPAEWAEFIGVQDMRGRRLVTVKLNPLRYHPVARRVDLASNVVVTVNHRPQRQAATGWTMTPLFEEILGRTVANPEPIRRMELPTTNQIPYVIITPASLTNSFAPLAAHREALFGANRTAIVTVEEILAEFPGRDDAEKLRNFIIQAVQTNGADFIVLGGDDTMVPARMAPIATESRNDQTPVDLYYSALDGDWDANRNNIFGELADDVDMLPDVIVSRIPVRTAQEAANYLAKLIAYESGARPDLHGKLFLSGTEGWNLIYGSARGGDEVFDGYPAFRAHQPVSDAEHWVRRIHRDVIQTNWSASVLDIFFDTLTTWDERFAGDFTQTPERFVDVYNQGWEYQYFDTHGNWNLYALEADGRFRNEHAAALTNLTCFITTVACLTAHFDGTNDPCLAEIFLRSEAGSLVYHGCARLGWGEGYPDYYGGPSPAYAMQYLKRLFDGSCGSFGEAYALGKAQFTGASTNVGTYRWLQFGINLLGDPAIVPRINTIPDAPILTSAVNTNQPASGLFVEWRDLSATATGFDLQRTGGTDDIWRVIASTGPGVTNYFDGTVMSNQFYLYRVRATNDAGHSIWSNPGGLVFGALPPDGWDPADDTPAGATALADMPAVFTNHGPHTLSANDTNDWFRFDVVAGRVYQFTTYSDDNFGGLFARVYDDQMNLVAEDGDTNGFNQFSFFLTPTNPGTWRMGIEPNSDRDSAGYRLYYRSEMNGSSSAALGAALDATQLVWRTSTDDVNPWFAQTNTFCFGDSAAQSGQIYRPDGTSTLHAAYSWMETSFEASSPAFLSFWQKTELDPGAQLIYDSPDGKQTISETTDWDKTVYALFDYESSTNVTLRWELVSSDSVNPINSRAWLDQFQVINEDDIQEIEFEHPVTGLLPAGRNGAYAIELSSPGYVTLTFDDDTAPDVRAYSSNGYTLQTEADGNMVRWQCPASGFCFFLLENNANEPLDYGFTPSLRAYLTHYVDANGQNPIPPYTNWLTAATVLQDAVDVAADGDIVLATNGVYAAGGRPAGGVYSLTNRLFATNAITVRSVHGAEYATILGSSDPATGGRGDGAVRCARLENGALLEGFTLSNGWSSATNDCETYGGGVWCSGTNARLERCVITRCSAEYGAGVYRGTLSGCMIAGNTAASRGGGAHESTLNACSIVDNESQIGGGADDCLLFSCLLSGNVAAESGGGAIGGALHNCTILGNSAMRGGGVASPAIIMENCIVYYNKSAVGDPDFYLLDSTNLFNICSVNAPAAGSGHITNAPLVAGIANPRLLPGSPCINAGTNRPWMTNATDWRGFSRIEGDIVDIGACEYQADMQMGDITAELRADFTPVAVGYPVEFTVNIKGECLGFDLNFGDAQSAANLARLKHSYAAPGQYDVALRASNLSATVFATATVHVAAQATTYVSLSGAHMPPFDSWANAATTVQAAVDAVCVGGEVLITNGAYAGGGRSAGGRHTLTNRVVVDRPVAVRSVNGTTHTFIVGAKDPDATNGPTAIRCVWLGDGASMEGFTLANGATSTNNNPDGYGGGAWCAGKRAILTNCVLTGNSAFMGGGVSDGTLYRCALIGNSADDGGGALCSDLYNCLLQGNVASRSGGGAAGCSSCTVTNIIDIFNCTIVSNSAPRGGGVSLGDIRNSIVFGNLGTNGVNNSDHCDLDHSCSQPLDTNGVGNIADDPLFLSAANLRLQATSPCINAGTNNPWMTGATDYAGNSRVIGPSVDMGAFEYLLTPTNLVAATNAAGGCLQLTWNEVSGAGGYAVFRATNNVMPQQELAIVQNGTYCDGTAQRGLHYYYWVNAHYLTDASAASVPAIGWLRENCPLGWLLLLME